jgi:hypothetical protein
MFGKSSTEPNFKLHLLRLKIQALYKRRENLWFAVVKERRLRLKLSWDFNYLFIFIDSLSHCMVAVVVVLTSYMLKLPIS